jgi:hypothetical protein
MRTVDGHRRGTSQIWFEFFQDRQRLILAGYQQSGRAERSMMFASQSPRGASPVKLAAEQFFSKGCQSARCRLAFVDTRLVPIVHSFLRRFRLQHGCTRIICQSKRAPLTFK